MNIKQTLTSLAAGALLYAGAAFAKPAISAGLPETRYVQMGVEVKYVLEQKYEIPLLEDRWSAVRDNAVVRLRRIIGETDYEMITIDSQGITAKTADFVCTDYGYKSAWCEDHHWNDKNCERECLSGKYDNWETEFSISYGEMRRIRQSTGILNDDNIEFNVGKKTYSIDTANSGVAVRAVELLQDICDIIETMEKEEKGILPSNSILPGGDVGAWDLYSRAREKLSPGEKERNDAADCMVEGYLIEDDYGLRRDEDGRTPLSLMVSCLEKADDKKGALQLVLARSRDFSQEQRSELERFVQALVVLSSTSL